MELPHKYSEYGLNTAKCWGICIMELYRLSIITMDEFGRFYHPRFLDGEPIDAREHQVVSLVKEILSDEPYFLSLARREQVEYTMPDEGTKLITSEADLIQNVIKDPSSIRFIQDPSPEIQMAAINRDVSVLKFIKNPCFEALMKVNGIGEQR